MEPDDRAEAAADGLARPAVSTAGLFGLALRQSGVGVLIAGPDRRFVQVNEAAAAMLGRTPADLIGASVLDLGPAEDRDAVVATVDRLYAGEIDGYSAHRRWIRADGGVVHVALTVSAVLDDDGRTSGLLAQAVDVSELQRAREEAREAESVLRGVIDSLLDPWVLLRAVRDEQGRIVDFEYLDANDAACRINRLPYDELVGRRLLDLLPDHGEGTLFRAYAEVVETGVALAMDDEPWISPLTGGSIRYYDNRAVKVGDGLSFTWRDVTDRVEHRNRLARMALTDTLTGLANRPALLDALDLACERVHAVGGAGAVLFCDLDGLKTVNDTYGHEAGDVVIRAVADRMRGAVRTSDLVARIGGDEFVVLAEGIRDDDAALSLALKVADAVTRPVWIDGVEILPRISTGVAVCWPGCTPQDLLRTADDALYREKARRRTADA